MFRQAVVFDSNPYRALAWSRTGHALDARRVREFNKRLQETKE